MKGVLNSDATSTSRSGDSTGSNDSAGSDAARPAGARSGRRTGTGPYLHEVTGAGGAHTPVWFMRQAGRSLPEYKEVRAGSTMLEACFNPEMTCEITLQPVRRHGVDAGGGGGVRRQVRRDRRRAVAVVGVRHPGCRGRP